MDKKKIVLEKSEKDKVEEALANSGDNQLDILNFVMAHADPGELPCGTPYPAYADSTYHKI